MENEVQYIFRKPLWRKILPLCLLFLLALMPFSFILAGAAEGENLGSLVVKRVLRWLIDRGWTFDRVLWATAIAAAPVLIWFYWGFEKLIITPDAIIRRLPLGIPRSLRWVDVDEVLIDHIENRFEGKTTAKKVLQFYAVRRRFIPWRRHMRISNSQFESYHHAERIAAQVSIPAIAARKREEIRSKGRPARFPIRERGDGIVSLLFCVTGIILLAFWGLDRAWTPEYATWRPYTLLVVAFLEITAFRKFFYRQVGVDEKNLYLMRRDFVMKKIPIESVVDVRVLDNRTRILMKKRGAKKPQVAFKTNRFIRNRGVLLRLIREAKEAREEMDSQPIVQLPDFLRETGEQSRADDSDQSLDARPATA